MRCPAIQKNPEVRKEPGDSIDDLVGGLDRFGGLVGARRLRNGRAPDLPCPAIELPLRSPTRPVVGWPR
jgi:hypothetical protein